MSTDDKHGNDIINVNEQIYNNYFSSLIAGNRQKCNTIISELMSRKHSVINLYQNVFKRSLYQVGILWEFNKISVAVEHMATSITEYIMNSIYPAINSSKRIDKKAIVCCVEDELHQIGAKMAADVFEMHGWNTIFLGANMPANELIRFIHETKPNVIGLSFSVYFHLNTLEKMLALIKNQFQNLRILVGGQAVRMDIKTIERRFSGVTCVQSLDELEQIIKEIT